MKISIIVSLFNQIHCTQAMFNSLISTLPIGLDIEIVFIDDASIDDTQQWLHSIKSLNSVKRSLNAIKCFRNFSNCGYAKSNNKAAALASGEILIFLNNDLILQPGWLEPMLATFSQHKKYPAIVGNLQYREDNGKLDHAGIEVLLDINTGHVIIDHCREIADQRPNSVFALTAACCLISNVVFTAAGGFNEKYLNGGEDVDLCLKIKQKNGVCLIAYDSAVKHHVSKTRGQVMERDLRNSLRLIESWTASISREIEAASAERLLLTSPGLDPVVRQMTEEYIAGRRKLAPIAVKSLARQCVDAEARSLRKLLDSTSKLNF